MATSPIYSWPEPDNTDLVKNGALAIRTLGNAIDTTMGTMVAKTIIDAKGDLIAGTAADTAARLAVGANGETLVADSSTSTGLRYTAGNPIPNPVLNSAYQVWQRGTSFAISAGVVTYVADRWCCLNSNTGSTVSRQTTSDTTNLPFIQYCARLARNSGTTNTGSIQITQSFETVNSLPFAGKTVTMSFYARAGANFSAASNQIVTYLITGTGTDQNHPSGYTGQATPVASTATLTTTWQRFTFTATIAATATEIAVNTGYAPVGTAGANDYYEVTGWQIDVGSVALPFRTNGATIQGELAACQRYYVRFLGSSAFSQVSGVSPAFSTTVVYIGTPLPVTMRIIPTAIESGTVSISNGSTRTALSSLTLAGGGSTQYFAQATATVASGLTAGMPYYLQENAGGTAAYLAFSSEL